MDTLELHNYLNCFLKTFQVVPSDKLVKSEYPLYIIVNSDPSLKPGKHWLAFYQASQESPLVFFDSYGKGYEFWSPHFKNFVGQTPIVENTRRLQSFNTNVCGAYCLYFLYQMYKTSCLAKIYNQFTFDTVQNDRFVSRFVKKQLCRRRSGHVPEFSQEAEYFRQS